MEYLVTYGWAILAIVIIAAVLWYTGVFNPSKIAGGGKSGGGFGVFTYSDHVVSTTAVSVRLGNAVGRSINVTDATVKGVACGTWTGGVPVAPNALVTIDCDNTGGVIVPGAQGDAYDVAVTVSYVDSQSGLPHTDTGGYLRGKIE